MAVRVVTVDDQPAFRRAVAAVVHATPGFELAGEAASGEEGLTIVGRLQPDVVLLDVRMPGIDGVETARQLSAERPDLVIVLISVQEPGAAPGAHKCGADALVAKRDLAPALLRDLWAEHGPSPN